LAGKKKEEGVGDGPPDELLAAIGERVKEIRTAAGMSQRDLGAAAGVSQGYIHLVEGGVQNITITVLHRLADGLGVPLGALFPESICTGSPSDYSLARVANTFRRWTEAIVARGEQDTNTLKEIGRYSTVYSQLAEFLEGRNSGKGTKK